MLPSPIRSSLPRWFPSRVWLVFDGVELGGGGAEILLTADLYVFDHNCRQATPLALH